jgi:hypothetical protein
MGTLASEFPPIQHGAIVNLRSVFLVKIDQVLPLPLFTSPRPFSNPISIWCYCPGYPLARHMVLFETWLCFRHRGKSSMYTVAQLLSLGHSNCTLQLLVGLGGAAFGAGRATVCINASTLNKSIISVLSCTSKPTNLRCDGDYRILFYFDWR